MKGARVMVDTNVLVYSFTATAPYHIEARDALSQLEAQNSELWISRQIIREYVSVLTRPQVFASPVSIDAIIGQMNTILTSFSVADDSASVTTALFDCLTS